MARALGPTCAPGPLRQPGPTCPQTSAQRGRDKYTRTPRLPTRADLPARCPSEQRSRACSPALLDSPPRPSPAAPTGRASGSPPGTTDLLRSHPALRRRRGASPGHLLKLGAESHWWVPRSASRARGALVLRAWGACPRRGGRGEPPRAELRTGGWAVGLGLLGAPWAGGRCP